MVASAPEPRRLNVVPPDVVGQERSAKATIHERLVAECGDDREFWRRGTFQFLAEVYESDVEGLPSDTDLQAVDDLAGFVVGGFDDPWLVSGTVALRYGRLVISRLSLTPNTGLEEVADGRRRAANLMPDAGLTSEVLRSIRLGDILTGVQEELAQGRDGGAPRWPGYLAPDLAASRAAQATESAASGRGRPRLPDLHYQQLALDYIELQGEPGVIRRLGERHRKPEATIKTWIREATDRGYLGPGTKGRRGREAGPRLERWAAMQHPKVEGKPRVMLSALAYHQRKGWRLIPGSEETP